MIQAHSLAPDNVFAGGHVEDIKLAASKMARVERRAFQAQMTVKYCAGSPRRAEALFGWSRDAVALGLHERRTGIVCFMPIRLAPKSRPGVLMAFGRLGAATPRHTDPRRWEPVGATPIRGRSRRRPSAKTSG